jgi:hypothetical protein
MYKLIFILVFVPLLTWSQQRYTVSGFVRDASNGEELIGVSVLVKGASNTGTVTNSYGFYSLTQAGGELSLQFSYIGYETQTISITLDKNLSYNIELKSQAQQIDEVIITGDRMDANVSDIQMSHRKIDMGQVRKLPTFLGEADIIKTIQMQPGVVMAGEGTSSFFVRGGSGDQNLILIDEAPIYDPSHLFGLFSVFNSDVIKEAELYKGGIPARFGGRLSSILEVRTKDGNNKQLTGSGGIGTLASRFALEGPIQKDKSSFLVSARRSYVDAFLALANNENSVYFYDVNAKVSWKYGNKNRFFAAFYSGRDKFSISDNFGFAWGNQTGTFRWNHLFSEKLFANTSVVVSNFDYKLGINDPVQGFDWSSKLQQASVLFDLSYYINPRNEINFGYHLSGRRFFPGTIKPNTSSSAFQELSQANLYALDHGLYVDYVQKPSEKISITYGLRLSIFQNIGKGDVYLYADPTDNVNIIRTDTLQYDSWQTIKTYINPEPRFSFLYRINAKSSVKASYNRMVQNTHLITSGTVPLPFNTWSPSNYYLKPQVADQVAIGYFRNFKDNRYQLSVETFYKTIDNITDFADNAQLFFNNDLSTEYRQGTSLAYGIEFLGEKKMGDLTGFVSYTLSKVTRTIPGVNQGLPFIANYDRRHAVNLAAIYELNPQWTFGTTFTYSTGRPITLPNGRYRYDIYNVDYVTSRNGYLLPDFHRLDLSATLNPKPRHADRKWQGQWVFSIYNVYNRKNPFTIYTRTKQDEDGNIIGNGTEKEARLIYLFPILPSVTYNFKF